MAATFTTYGKVVTGLWWGGAGHPSSYTYGSDVVRKHWAYNMCHKKNCIVGTMTYQTSVLGGDPPW